MKEVKYPVAVSASELKKMEIPQIVWIVDRLLPVGVSMIGAPSKYFKSYMALGLCLAVCTGEKFLSFQCNKYACLYLDLESTKRRPKSRLKQIIPNGDWPENFYILTAEDEVSKINEGFTEQIEHQLNQHPDIKLIIVDVFQMIRQPAKRNQSGYDRDYDDFKVLKRIADSHEIALLLIHHTRKMKDPGDVFNELSGSVGVMGDERTYAYLVGIRAVTSSDGMTSDWYKMPYDVLEKISNRIVNEVDGANRVVYDITSKPPVTIECE